MSRRKINAFLWTRTNLPDLSATIYRDSDTRKFVVVYHEGREKIGDSFHTDKDDAEETANAELAAWGKMYATKRVVSKRRGAAQKRAMVRLRSKNPEPGPAGRKIPAQSEIGAFIKELDRITLYAVPIGKVRVGVNAWEAGQVFQAVNPPRWTGSPFFRVSDAQRIYDMGYRKIIIMGGAGETFDVDLVMQ